MNEKARTYVFTVAALCVLAGAITYITKISFAPYIFAVGAAGITVCFMTLPYQDLDFRQRRLHRINVMAGILMVVASMYMFKRQSEWIVFLTISALIILYTSFRGVR